MESHKNISTGFSPRFQQLIANNWLKQKWVKLKQQQKIRCKPKNSDF